MFKELLAGRLHTRIMGYIHPDYHNPDKSEAHAKIIPADAYCLSFDGFVKGITNCDVSAGATNAALFELLTATANRLANREQTRISHERRAA